MAERINGVGELVEEMAEDGTSTAIRLQMPEETYQRVRHAAVDDRTNASAWIRDAIERKLGDVPEDAGLARLCGVWHALNDDSRAHLLWVAERVAEAYGTRSPERP